MGSRLETNSTNVRKRIEAHTFDDENGEEYSASTFGGFSDYMRRKKLKLQNLDVELRAQSTDNPAIFKGIVVHVNGYTQPSLSDLHKLIVSYGGGFMQYLDGKTAVTHVVCANLTPKKKVEFARYRVVKPSWVVESVREGKILPWERFRVVDEGVAQKVLGWEEGKMVSQAKSQQRGYREQTETSWYTSQLKEVARGIDKEGRGVFDEEDVRREERPKPHTESEVGTGPPPKDIEIEFQNDENAFGEDQDSDPQIDDIEQPSIGLEESLLEDDEADLILRPEKLVFHSLTTESSRIEGPNNPALPEPNPPTVSRVSQPPEKRLLTAEEHNAILLSNPHLAKSSTANPDFINQYYRESRLHHLSTWKSELKTQLQARAAEQSLSQKARRKRPAGARRYIMHVDFDSFFAAVSLRNHPELATKPVVIAHGSGPGSEIASCNYPARAFGVKNGMWMKSALQLCPDIKVLPYDFKAYEEASRHFYDSILAVDGVVQSISIDEALVDVSQQCFEAGGFDEKGTHEETIPREQTKANELALKLRTMVKEKTGCEVSVGVGNNILLAKVALRKAKPAGQYLIKPEEVLEFLGELTVTDLPGVAWSIGNKLEEIRVKHVKDIRLLTKERLVSALGPKTGEKIWDYSRGIDKAEVGDQVVRKSVSAEINWGIRFVTQQQAEEFVQCLCDELHRRLLEQAVKGKQLTMKIMRKAADAGMDPPKNLGHGKCDTFNKSVVLKVATNDKALLGKEAISILRSYGFSPGELRGLGVQMQKLEPLKPLSSTTMNIYDGSQRRLQFKKQNTTTTPSKLTSFENSGSSRSKYSRSSQQRLKDTPDPIEDVPTPEKPACSSRIFGAFDDDVDREKSSYVKQRPLNMTGTQFLLPTQADPKIIAELPAGIRSKLAPRQKQTLDTMLKPKIRLESVEAKSRSASPFPSDHEHGLPNQSQIDPDILQALPEDVREELLEHYRTTTARSITGIKAQSVLPQSPRKSKTIPPSEKLILTPTKKEKPTSILGRGKANTNLKTKSTLTQSKFLSLAKPKTGVNSLEAVDLEQISQSFLDELPEDIRQEILSEQKKTRLQSKAGLTIGDTKKNLQLSHGLDPNRPKRTKRPPRPPRPTFTSKKLSRLKDLRKAMSLWVEEFSVDGEEGPFDEDVAALKDYLVKVVTIERDLAKAVAVVEWVMYLVGDQESPSLEIANAWKRTISSLQSGVQVAAGERGLPPVDFGDR